MVNKSNLSPSIHLCPLETGGPRNEVPEGVDKNEDEDERLKAAEQRLIATGSQVNVAEQRLNAAEQQVNCDDSQVKSCVAAVKGDGLEGNQSQGDDSPATPLRLTSSSAAINRSEAAHRYNGV